MSYKSFAELFADAEKRDSYFVESAILDFTIDLHRLMKKRGLTKKEFADLLGTSQAYITRVFRGDANFTIKTMVKLVRALDGSLTIQVSPKEEDKEKWFGVIDPKKPCSPKWKFSAVASSDQYMTSIEEENGIQYAA